MKVLQVMTSAPSDDIYGLELIRRTGLKSGTLYPLLDRIEMTGWLVSHWEDGVLSSSGGPRRRFYRLTGVGLHEARHAFAEHGALTSVRWV